MDVDVDVDISPSVNGKENKNDIERRIEKAMRERMAKVFCLFRANGVDNLALGSCGTGAFGCVIFLCVILIAMMDLFGYRNNINTIATI
jgi:hypothetical protein